MRSFASAFTTSRHRTSAQLDSALIRFRRILKAHHFARDKAKGWAFVVSNNTTSTSPKKEDHAPIQLPVGTIGGGSRRRPGNEDRRLGIQLPRLLDVTEM